MRNIKRTAALVAAVLTLSATAACGDASEAEGGDASPKNQKIGALYFDTNGFYGGVKKGIETAAGDGYELIGSNVQGDASKESQFMSTLVSGKVAAIVMTPVSPTASVPAVRAAAEAGIPVVCYNTCLNDADAAKYVKALVTTDNKEFGAAMGDFAADYFTKEGVKAPKVAILGCPQIESCALRGDGFIEALQKKLPEAEILVNLEGNKQDVAVRVATDVMTAHPDMDGFFAANEGATLGEVQAIKSKGKNLPVFGLDITNQIAELLLDGSILKGVNAQFPQDMGKKATELAIQAAKGEKVEPFLVEIPTKVYSSASPDEVKQWLKDHADGLP